MSKRYTHGEKWDNKWYRKLSPDAKLIYNFFCDRCDWAGFYDVDMDDMEHKIGMGSYDISEGFEELSVNDLLIRKDDLIWLTRFVEDQRNLPLNADNNAHKSIINLINKHLKLFPKIVEILGADEGLFSPPVKYSKCKVNNLLKEKEGMQGERKHGRFVKPAIEEVKEYCMERVNDVDCQLWFDHYESNGWMIGKNKMVSWKAAVRKWEKGQTKKSTNILQMINESCEVKNGE